MSECKQCKQSFEITKQDLQFYDKVSPVIAEKKYSIPAPTHCPDCRRQRRLAFRNERNLYKRSCDFIKKNVISIYSPESEYKVYDQDVWWSDKWDPMEYGKDFDFSRSFFDQFNDLMKVVPRNALINIEHENSFYANCSGFNKDCYLCFDSAYSQDCLYSKTIFRSQNLVDCSYCEDHSSYLYDSIHCTRAYMSVSCINCTNIADCYFSYNLKNCKNCMFCFNLSDKEYCFDNQQYSKEEYEEKLQKLITGSYEKYQTYVQHFLNRLNKCIHRFAHILNSEKVTGDYIENCNNCYESFGAHNCEDCKFLFDSQGGKNCYDDCFMGVESSEMNLETLGSYNSNNMKFIISCWSCNDVMYSDYCQNSQNCFGCISLKHKKYCILNKQYSKEDYEKLLPRIIEHMRNTGEWGEYFPMQLSPFAYNESVAHEYYPKTEDECNLQGFGWLPDDPDSYSPSSYKIPDNIQDVSDLISQEILSCQECHKNYRVIEQEISFYRKMKLPIPRKCHDCRHNNRMSLKNPRRLWNRECGKCEKEIKTTFDPTREDLVFCEECYLGEVY